MNFPSIILASQSPRRRELLKQIDVHFEVVSIDVDETHHHGEDAQTYVQRVAMDKALTGWHHYGKSAGKPVLGADTTVVLANEIMGKPRDESDAREMLERLSGNTHQVMSAVALVKEHMAHCLLSTSYVTFARLTSQQIDWYIATGEGIDKAGSYAVQGLAALFIECIQGSYSGIMGLPLRETGKLLQQLEVAIEQ